MVLSWGPGSKGAKIYDSVLCAMSTPARPPRVVPLNAGVLTCPWPEASTRHRSIRTIAASSRERNLPRKVAEQSTQWLIVVARLGEINF